MFTLFQKMLRKVSVKLKFKHFVFHFYVGSYKIVIMSNDLVIFRSLFLLTGG